MQYRKIISLIYLSLSLVSCSIAADQNYAIPSLTVDSGPITGVIKGKSVLFLGIPYASPPVGDLRWRPPQVIPSWKEPLDATQPGAHCPQTRHQDMASEDCLTINVYIPSLKSEEPLPVLFWIHGGGYRTGTGAYYSSRNINNPAELVDAKLWNRQGVILVTLNYRLGALGLDRKSTRLNSSHLS